MPNQRVVTIDIETLPASEPIDIFLSEKDKASEHKLQEAHRKTALSGDFGRLLCIGYSDERPGEVGPCEALIGWSERANQLHADETLMLEEFWSMMKGFAPRRGVIVGHNVFEFDLRFILKRSIINRVRPTVALSFAKYRSQPLFDTMCEWECWSYGNRISLDKLAFALSLPSSKFDDINGSRVYDLYQAGRHEEIRDYCLRDDVGLTREVYRRMKFASDDRYSGYPSVDRGLSANFVQ